MSDTDTTDVDDDGSVDVPVQTREEREHLLANLPKTVRRVKVLEPAGKERYKPLDEVDLDDDEILLNSRGEPIVMKGRPGRRPLNILKPISAMVSDIEDARSHHIEFDALRSQTATDLDSELVFRSMMVGLAEEAAHLEFERKEAARKGEDTSGIAIRRARVLKNMTDAWLKRKQQTEGGIIDLDSATFQALFGLILETFRDALVDAGTRPEQIETVFSKLASALKNEGWKQDAKARMRDKT